MKRILLMILALTLGSSVMVGTAGAEYQVGLTHGTDKQRPEYGFAPQNTFHLFSAQNEWEPFQVLVRDDDGVTGVNVEVTDFTGPGDPIAAPELSRVHYVPVPPDKISQTPPDPNNAGLWPDALVPFVDHFAQEIRSGAPFDVPAAFTQAVWGDLYVPEDQEPGDYTATVTVTASGRTDWTGTVTLTVWDFALPMGLSLASNYGWGVDGLCSWHASHGGVSSCNTLNDWYLEELARHRMSPYNPSRVSPGYAWNYGTGTFDWDWSEFDEKTGPYFDGTFYKPGYKFTGYTLPGPPGGRPGDVAPADWEREYWKGWAQHFREHGWNDVLYSYLPDEPRPETYPALKDLAARLHAADPDLQPMVTEQFEEGLAGDIDIWCPDEPLFSDSLPNPPYPEVYDERRAMGEKTWWYNCVSAMVLMDFASHAVDAESTYMRIWTWLTRRYHFTGILYWSTVYNIGGSDPWDSMWAEPFFQGDGSLWYPGTIDRIGGTTDIPIPSLRMKYLREAMEDYEYFHILDERGDGEWVDDLTRTVAPKTFQWEHDWRKVLDSRRKVAEKILGTLDETPPAPPTGLSAQGEPEGALLSWTAPADTDLAGYDVRFALYEGDQFFGGTVGAGAITAEVTGLTPGREYSLWMKSFDAEGNRSAPSDVVVVTPMDAGDDEESLAKAFPGSPNLVSVHGADDVSGAQDKSPGSNDDDDDDSNAGCGCGC